MKSLCHFKLLNSSKLIRSGASKSSFSSSLAKGLNINSTSSHPHPSSRLISSILEFLLSHKSSIHSGLSEAVLIS